ncbi:HAMP domain-containing histidine kinase [Ideonella sp. 4Y16]|uniref:sensor histidine kinase n=1 Tax=Ideonella alba TaxID=2824118 RepID=UPI001B38ADC8|nr:HAMP domain-containing sensor histidine kinase [Ideonella alba]MBQ0945104.1 HAMP domain-containing histidine kinase [Ideonella alba]
MLSLISVPSLFVASSITQALLGVSCWLLLRQRHGSDRLRPWAFAAVASGGWMLLLGLRGIVPDWAGFPLANALAFAGMLLTHLALRREAGESSPPALLAALWLLLSTAYLLIDVLAGVTPRFLFAASVLAAGFAINARLAWRAAAVLPSRSGQWLAALLGAWAAVAASRVVWALWDPPSANVAALTPANLATWVMCYALGLFGNVAYLGMVLDRVRSSEARAQAAEYAERARRESAEQHAGQLTEALTQLDALAREREQLLGVLAHEIRQPLHRATGALLSAGAALRGPRADVQAIAERLDAAETVLGELRSVLDNTLAAAQILTRREQVTLQDVDLDLLIELVMGDLAPDQRQRVVVERLTRLRTLEVEPGLVRLALRNLLRNAFVHGGDGQSLVQLRIEESHSPYGMALSVCDHGHGLSASHWAHLDDPATHHKPFPSQRGQGLGLSVVRQIMSVHGGQLVLRPVQPSGLEATMLFPWPDTRTSPRQRLA